MNLTKDNFSLIKESKHVFNEELSFVEEYHFLRSYKVAMDNLSFIENSIRGFYHEPYGCMEY